MKRSMRDIMFMGQTGSHQQYQVNLNSSQRRLACVLPEFDNEKGSSRKLGGHVDIMRS